MQTTKQPYEFLARWNAECLLAGAHVQFRYIIRDGDLVLGESLGPAEPVPAEQGTFQLASVLSAEEQQLLATIAQRDVEISAQAMRIQEQEAKVAACEAEIETLKAALAEAVRPIEPAATQNG